MKELFENTQRELYHNPPLLNVICQLKFPKLLSIDAKPPSDFQELIRGSFPLMQRGPSFPQDLPPGIAEMLLQQGVSSGFQFLTEDRGYVVELSSEAVSLSTTKYTVWEDFQKMLVLPLQALAEIYKPSFFNRLGLRYQNAIDRNRLNLNGTPWSKLLRTELLGEISLPQIEENLEGVASRTLRMKNPDGTGSVLLNHGLANVQGREGPCYIIDFDFFIEGRTEVDNAVSVLNHFNGFAGRAFRWCIQERLRQSLSPVTSTPAQ